MGRPLTSLIFLYEDLEKLIDPGTRNAIYQHRSRGKWHPEFLESVILYVARHGTLELRAKIVGAALLPMVIDDLGEPAMSKRLNEANEIHQDRVRASKKAPARKRTTKKSSKRKPKE